MGSASYAPVANAAAPTGLADEDASYAGSGAGPVSTKRSLIERWRGWRGILCRGVLATLLGMTLNIVLLGYGGQHFNTDHQDTPLYVGNCRVVSIANSVAHVGVNILATLLVSAASNTINYLTAPSREDIDRLHACDESVEIGVWDLRNWKIMSTLRKFLFCCAIMSSVPLHLFYNSVFTTTYVADDWVGFVVPQTFTSGSAWDSSFLNRTWPEAVPALMDLQKNATNGSMQRLDVASCQHILKSSLVLNYSAILFVTSQSSSDSSTVLPSLFMQHESVNNIDAFGVASGASQPSISNFTINHYEWLDLWNQTSAMGKAHPQVASNLSTVQYCLLQQQPEQCSIQLVPQLIAPVVLFNALGALAGAVLFFRKSFQPLATLGDAIASFLHRACPHSLPRPLTDIQNGRIHVSTSGKSVQPSTNQLDRLLSRVSIHSAKSAPKFQSEKARDLRWYPTVTRWHSAVSSARWFWTSMLFTLYWLAGLISVFIVLGKSSNASYALTQGVGGPSPASDTSPSLIYNFHDFLGNVLLANVFQVILASNYLFYQNILARMALAGEFGRFVTDRNTLRVSNPVGEQRAGYWFALPHRLALALLAVSAALHFLISEAIFYEQLRPRILITPQADAAPTFQTTIVHAVICNPEALLIFEAVGLLAPASAFAFGWLRRFAPGAPLVTGDSRVIAALSAHRPEVSGDYEALQPLQWGVIEEWQDGGCVGFSSGAVKPLEGGKLYELK